MKSIRFPGEVFVRAPSKCIAGAAMRISRDRVPLLAIAVVMLFSASVESEKLSSAEWPTAGSREKAGHVVSPAGGYPLRIDGQDIGSVRENQLHGRVVLMNPTPALIEMIASKPGVTSIEMRAQGTLTEVNVASISLDRSPPDWTLLGFEDERVVLAMLNLVARFEQSCRLTIGGPITFQQALGAIRGSRVSSMRWMYSSHIPSIESALPNQIEVGDHQLEVLEYGGMGSPSDLNIILTLPSLVSLDMSRCVVSQEWAPESCDGTYKVDELTLPTGTKLSQRVLSFLKRFDELRSLSLTNSDLDGRLAEVASISSITDLSIKSCSGYDTRDLETLFETLKLRKMEVGPSGSLLGGFRKVVPVLDASVLKSALKQPQLEELLLNTPINGDITLGFTPRCDALVSLTLAHVVDSAFLKTLGLKASLSALNVIVAKAECLQYIIANMPNLRDARITIGGQASPHGEIARLSELKSLSSLFLRGDFSNAGDDLAAIAAIPSLCSLRLYSTLPATLPANIDWGHALQVISMSKYICGDSLKELIERDQLLSITLVSVGTEDESLYDLLAKTHMIRHLRLYGTSDNAAIAARALKSRLSWADVHVA